MMKSVGPLLSEQHSGAVATSLSATAEGTVYTNKSAGESDGASAKGTWQEPREKDPEERYVKL